MLAVQVSNIFRIVSHCIGVVPLGKVDRKEAFPPSNDNHKQAYASRLSARGICF